MAQITAADFLSTSKWKTTRYKLFPPDVKFYPRDINGVRRVINGVVMNDVGDLAVQTEKLADTMLARTYALLSRHNIIPNEVQEQMLTSHVRAMAHRSVTGEPLPEVEASLFEEISEDSMRLAREVVAEFGNLPEEEAWLLSVHFEVAKDNL
ncbi:PRD domain protein, EF_0829/AHA_3910 family [Yokenella regensburgei ATCC 43003]|nr:PRD domain protein, EF_0829/AHA_3910 family [Yokenella regensburgei ATCC 43003]